MPGALTGWQAGRGRQGVGTGRQHGRGGISMQQQLTGEAREMHEEVAGLACTSRQADETSGAPRFPRSADLKVSRGSPK